MLNDWRKLEMRNFESIKLKLSKDKGTFDGFLFDKVQDEPHLSPLRIILPWQSADNLDTSTEMDQHRANL